MRLLLDASILLPQEDSDPVLRESYAGLVRLVHANHHELVYHPASEEGFLRDWNAERRRRNLEAIKQYPRMEERPRCPWNSPYTRPDDALENELLYALHCEAAHALITEDRRIREKARERGLLHCIHTIQTAEDWLRRLHAVRHVQLPDIEDIGLDTLPPQLTSESLQHLRESCPQIDDWFGRQAIRGGRAWIVWEQPGVLGAICVYSREDDVLITEDGPRLDGPALKLDAFGVSPRARSRKIGELFLKHAFQYAMANRLDNIVVHGDVEHRHCLFAMLEDFGFSRLGWLPGSEGREVIYCKPHPVSPPAETIEPFDYLRRFFPHFRHDPEVNKFIIPLRPGEHTRLFPEYRSPSGRQLSLFSRLNPVDNVIKLACLCYGRTCRVGAGDVALFYRSGDERAVTSLGVVEYYETLRDAGIIAARMKRRTVYSMKEIESMVVKPTSVMLFRLVRHLSRSLPQPWLEANGVLRRAPRGMVKISDDAFERVLANGG
jgi:hypothetical protein